MGVVQVRLFGPALATSVGGEVVFSPDLRYQCLAYLAYRGDWVTREDLAHLYWSDSPPSVARRNLRQLFLRLRRLVWIEDLEIAQHSARWSVPTDVNDFRTALHEERWNAAVELYRGPLLAGLDGGAATEYQAWLEHERGQLQSAWRDAGLRHADDLARRGRAHEAATQLEALLHEDDLDEEALRSYMNVMARSGRAETALATYHAFAERLGAELDLEPASATEQLAHELRSGRVTHAEETAVPQTVAVTVAVTPVLPAPPPRSTAFVGREVELATIAHRLAQPECRLLTLIGPGGIGKTRLAQQVATEIENRYPDGVAFIALEGVAETAAIPGEVAAALGLASPGSGDSEAQIVEWLREKRLLLVLDNYEHLIDGAEFAARLLASCPRLDLLVTSRERLHLEEEWLVQIEGLPYPELAEHPGDDLLDFDALRLFIERAQRLRPGFSVDAGDRAHLLTICRTLGGSPLGIELAAAWVRTLPLAEIAAQISANLEFLASRTRNAQARHRSVRAAFDHSWDLLSGGEQRVLRRLAIFRGGCRLEATVAVAGARLAVLAALVDKSLLRLTASGRYEGHPLLEQFGREKLEEHPAERDDLAARHGRYYLRLLEERMALGGGGQSQEQEAIAAELPNILAAWSWAVDQGDDEALSRSAAPLRGLLELGGRNRAGLAAFTEAVGALESRSEPPRRLLGRLLGHQAHLCFTLGQTDRAAALARRSLERLRGCRDPLAVVRSLNVLGLVAMMQGDYEEARTSLRAELALGRRHRLDGAVVKTLGNLAIVEHFRGDYRLAEEHYRENLAIHRRRGDVASIIQTLNNLGHLLLDIHQPRRAQGLLQEGLELARDHEISKTRHHLLGGLGTAAGELGHLDEAEELLRTSLRHAREAEDSWQLAALLPRLGRVVARRGDEERGRDHLHEGLRIAREAGNVPAILDGLILLAELEADARPDTAAGYLGLVLEHPAAKHSTRDAARRRLALLDVPTAPDLPEFERLIEEIVGAAPAPEEG